QQYLCAPVTIVTQQNPLSRMVGQWDVATVAHRNVATLSTKDTACSPTTVEVEDSLLSCIQNALKFALQATTENAGISRVQFATQVHYLDWRQICSDTPRQFD